MYPLYDRTTTLLSIPEHQSQDENNDCSNSVIATASATANSSFDSFLLQQQDEQQQQRRDVLLSRRLRRMKRKLFLEAVGEEYIASKSLSSPSASCLQTQLSSSSSMESTED